MGDNEQAGAGTVAWRKRVLVVGAHPGEGVVP